jgi:hypothetical protein
MALSCADGHPVGGRLHCVPSMTIDLEVEVLSEADRSDRSEPQGADREGSAESSGERDLWGDEQKPDGRRDQSGRMGNGP